MSATLHVIRESTLLDVPATLRNIADAIERGEAGEVRGAVVVVDGAQVQVHYAGTGEPAPNAHLPLHAGAAKMMKVVMEAKGG